MGFTQDLVKAANGELAWWKNAGCKECGDGCKERVAKYWKNLGVNLDGCSDQAWSAAFICFCMNAAQMPRLEFPYSIAHEAYIRWSIQNQKLNKPNKTYYGQRATQYAPKLGDMVAKARAANIDYDHIPDRFFPSHCDIVVGFETGKVLCVGGNVSNKVSVTKYAIDGKGRIVNPSASKIICVMDCRK